MKNGKEAHCADLPFVSCLAVGHLGSPLEDFQCGLIPRWRTCRLNEAAILEGGGNELPSAAVMAKVTRDADRHVIVAADSAHAIFQRGELHSWATISSAC